mmetsp:Transcript_15007/g.44816  ORF Transcript_15007/g.44816 Transcript_15007/m.44816 type:complete len:184 (-) Transcript_15007:52-603(-)
MGLVDDEIARLEAELADDGSDSDDESVEAEVVADGVLASLESERIAPLPAHLLPQQPTKKRQSQPPGDPRKRAKGPEALFRAAPPEQIAAARALVAAAAKSEKIKAPFWCRLCAFRGADLEAYQAHIATPLHLIATKLWKEASACALCRVQTTSPNELAVHLKSKKHLERVAYVNSTGKQQRR